MLPFIVNIKRRKTKQFNYYYEYTIHVSLSFRSVLKFFLSFTELSVFSNIFNLQVHQFYFLSKFAWNRFNYSFFFKYISSVNFFRASFSMFTLSFNSIQTWDEQSRSLIFSIFISPSISYLQIFKQYYSVSYFHEANYQFVHLLENRRYKNLQSTCNIQKHIKYSNYNTRYNIQYENNCLSQLFLCNYIYNYLL